MTERSMDRRQVLLGLLASGTTATLSGCGLFSGGGHSPATVPPDRALKLAERFAPTLYFDEDETWFPTDPRPWRSERGGDTVVHGFDAVEGYLTEFEAAGREPPDPTVFYNARQYGDEFSVVQFWMYYAFDQFATNFHWHDWEMLSVFIDESSDDPILYVASAHARRVPNNEFLDPNGSPRILIELGSHSSGLSVNERPSRFDRYPHGVEFPDVTNESVEGVEQLTELPLAYGLPRDEGTRFPYVIPELDGVPVYDHPELPTFDRSHLVPPELTVRSFDALASPPTDLPTRSTGTVVSPADDESEGDVQYELVPTREANEIDSFVGPQLSFEFPIPSYVEDAVEKHITASGTPWHQERYDDPVTDVTDPTHINALAERYEAVEREGLASDVVGAISGMVSDPDAPDTEGIQTTVLGVESLLLLQSEPTAAPTFAGGVVAMRNVPSGDHRLVVNTPGAAPYGEEITAEGTTVLGVEGEMAVPPLGEAVKLRLDGDGTDVPVAAYGVADDFGGQIYEATPAGRDAVYVHGDGAYTVDVRDENDEPGAFRVNPSVGQDGPVTIDEPTTGKASMASYLEALFDGTRTTVTRGADERPSGLLNALDSVVEAAARARDRAAADDPRGADRQLDAVITRIDNVRNALSNASIPEATARAVRRRSDIGETKAEQGKGAST